MTSFSSDEIDTFVRELNAAWQSEDWAGLGACYHEHAVLLPPDAGEPIVGREAILETYREFTALAKLNAFSIPALDVFHFGDTYMAHMRFTVDYVYDGDHTVDSGLEIYTIVVTDRPRVVWRQQCLLEQRTIV
jgi:ketosteroid isomerase-like protein